ncbi:MAG: hypothetical protein HON23_00510 [Rickettsiales bacterium]|jgi:hypothetical protein|nr:hypothetical protein [Rickettsiales bacterium]
MNRSIILILLTTFCSSCVTEAFSYPKAWNWGSKPRYFMMRGMPDQDDDYTKGYADGCQSNFTMVAQGAVRSLSPQYDGWKLTTNRLYAAGFVDGEEHCTYAYDWDIT